MKKSFVIDIKNRYNIGDKVCFKVNKSLKSGGIVRILFKCAYEENKTQALLAYDIYNSVNNETHRVKDKDIKDFLK